jgi:hypothetical protein
MIADARSPKRLTIAIGLFETEYVYELAQLPHDFALIGNTHERWDCSRRPLPQNVRISFSAEEANPDVLVLGVNPWSWIEIDQRLLFKRLRDHFSVPTIVVNHASNLLDDSSLQGVRDLIGESFQVFETEAAMSAWKPLCAQVIRRGLTLSDWQQTDYSRGNVVTVRPDRHLDYYNDAAIRELIARPHLKVSQLGRERKFQNFDAYRYFLSSSSIFFNPSVSDVCCAQMIEAWLAGLVTVTTDANGESSYIDNGENGFASNDMKELYDFIEFLCANPNEIPRIGANGRRLARTIYDGERFRREWQQLLEDAAAARAEIA